jgi:hypothetical protein
VPGFCHHRHEFRCVRLASPCGVISCILTGTTSPGAEQHCRTLNVSAKSSGGLDASVPPTRSERFDARFCALLGIVAKVIPRGRAET